MADPWVAPDSQPGSDPGPATVAPGPGAPPAPTGGRAGAPPAVPVPLRPLTVPDILDGALRAWKLAPASVVGLAAAFVIPAQGLLGVVTRDDVDDVELGQTFGDLLTATGPDDVDAGLGGAAFVLAVVTQGVALAFVTAGVATLVSGWYVGRSAGPGELIAAALRRWWALLAAWVLVHLVEAAFAVLLLVPAIVPMTWFAVVSAVVACEGAGPVRAMRRSVRLVNRRFGTVLGICLLVALVDGVLSFALTAVGGLYLELDLPLGWVVNTAVAAGALLVTIPFVAGVVTLLYLDLRVRTEGLDIELAASRRLPP
jgi:hypothetical protein